jgi:hypothetical protein
MQLLGQYSSGQGSGPSTTQHLHGWLKPWLKNSTVHTNGLYLLAAHMIAALQVPGCCNCATS